MSVFQLRRLKVLMEAGNPQEALGVLNPAAVRRPGGELYLFARLVAKGNYSRIGLARVLFDEAGEPKGVERLGIALVPIAVLNHAGEMQLARRHRPLAGTRRRQTARPTASRLADLDHESIWISYCPPRLEGRGPPRLGLFNSHHRLATPVSRWEKLKIGGGVPLILTRHGWLIVYHGVNEVLESHPDSLCYSVGVMVLSKEHPQVIRFRSEEPALATLIPKGREGVTSNVVFPTGIDWRDDLGLPDRIDVCYGRADDRMGVARRAVPAHLPPDATVADSSQDRPTSRARPDIRVHA